MTLRPISSRWIRSAIAENRDYDVEYRVVKPDGRIGWIIARGHAVYDETGSFERRANPENITWGRLASSTWEAKLRELVEAHAEATDSKWSRGILDDWDRSIGHFWQVVPKEMLTRLPHPLNDNAEAVAAE